MVAGFRRSLTLPSPNPNSPRPKTGAPEKYSYHVRSTSLPCQSHPVISHLEDDIHALRTWQSQPELEESAVSSACLCASLSRLEILHASVDDFLHLSQDQDSLRRPGQSVWTENLLEVFLRFADAHGTFRSLIMALRENQSAAKVAIRRRDQPRLASCVRSQRRIEKELIRLASALRDVTRSPASHCLTSDAGEADVAAILREVVTVTVSVSVAVFSGIAAASSATLVAPPSSSRSSWMVAPLRRLSSYKKNSDEGEAWRSSAALLERLEELEECIVGLESRSERVFRSLVNTRVSLLNLLTPSL